jgi:hypothetical protein
MVADQYGLLAPLLVGALLAALALVTVLADAASTRRVVSSPAVAAIEGDDPCRDRCAA